MRCLRICRAVPLSPWGEGATLKEKQKQNEMFAKHVASDLRKTTCTSSRSDQNSEIVDCNLLHFFSRASDERSYQKLEKVSGKSPIIPEVGVLQIAEKIRDF